MALKLENIDLMKAIFSAFAGFSTDGTNSGNSIALSQLWLVKISQEDMANVFEDEIQPFFRDFEGIKWDFYNDAPKVFQPHWYAGGEYYFLAQGCVFPGDSLTSAKVGVNQTGMLKGPINEMRNDLSSVTITFHETNQSTADLFFRPWAIMVGHKSLKHMPLRKDIELICLQKGGKENTLKVRKRVVLEKACPIEVDPEEYNYTGGKLIQRQVQFVYNRYHIIADAGEIQGTIEEVYQDLADAKGLNRETVFAFLGPYLDYITQANRLYTQVRGRIDALGDQATQVLRNLGLEDQARSIEEAFQDLDEDLRGVEDIIGRAERGETAVGIADQTITDILNLPGQLANTNLSPDNDPIIEIFTDDDFNLVEDPE